MTSTSISTSKINVSNKCQAETETKTKIHKRGIRLYLARQVRRDKDDAQRVRKKAQFIGIQIPNSKFELNLQ